jgi:xanthine dehydrogenase YagR molybdenum-binding subunit
MNTPASSPRVLGRPIDRVDGRLKVLGQARYAAEFTPEASLYAFALRSTISHGRIVSIDTGAAANTPGVRHVLTHLNSLKFPEPAGQQKEGGGIRNEERMPLSDDRISYGGQYVALVVAESPESARHAASLIEVHYQEEPFALDATQAQATAKKPDQNNGEPVQIQKGAVAAALANPAFVTLEETYETPTLTHNPMEPSATVAEWDAQGRLTLHDATQYVKGVQDVLAQAFSIEKTMVRVICPFVGGAFGCKGAVWPHVILTAMAAKIAGRPVKFPITRQDMFMGIGHRTPTRQTMALAATRDGKLQAIRHQTETLTSPVGAFVESCGARSTGVLYASPSIQTEETVFTVNISTPTFMRAPGECPGTFAVESAMDELAVKLNIDPVELRLRNYSEAHPVTEKPWSTKHLREAYLVGAEKFGWAGRSAKPRSMVRNGLLVGWGMATATYPGYKMMATVRVRLDAAGRALVQCATHDLGTGAYTVFTQISAEALGLPVEQVKFELGDSDLPFGPVAGGSNSTATVGAAIYEAAKSLHLALAKLASADTRSPLHGADPEQVHLSGEGRLSMDGDATKTDTLASIVQRSGQPFVEGVGGTKPPEEKGPLAFQSFGTHFCEVLIDPAAPRVRVARVVSVMDCGRVLNPKTARSQIMGGVVMGIGMALTEETVYDPVTGLPIVRNLADYHVPVNADIPDLEVHFVGEPDLAFNPMGARGMGEIGITGTAAAVANAVYHATGKRVRDLPITLDKLQRT